VNIGCTPNFCGIGVVYPEDLEARMKTGPVQGGEIVITGAAHEGIGMALKDALVEIWQADSADKFTWYDADADPHFNGFGRSLR
jgi:protocatechuate 3,4-dioxygenase alpha subunit